MAQAGETVNNGYVLLARAVVRQSLTDIRNPEPYSGYEKRNWDKVKPKLMAEAAAWWQGDEPRFWCQAGGYDYDKLATRLWQILEEAEWQDDE